MRLPLRHSGPVQGTSSGRAIDSWQPPKSSRRRVKVAGIFPLGAAGQQFLFQHVFADDAEIHHTVHHQPRNIVVAHPHDIDRHIFGKGQQALLLQIDFYAALLQQLLRFFA